MPFWAEMDRRARSMGILDTKLAQAAAIFFILAVVKLIPRIMTVSIWWFVGLAVVCAIKPIYTFYFASGESASHAHE
jgi:hypothetical protein